MYRCPWSVVPAALLAGLLLPSAAVACLWDYDTIRMERTRFPGTLELITGKFLRHSPEFYRWRIDDRLKRLGADPANVALLDDLAVAYDKTGQHDRAIETALRTEQLRPGRYETAANLGTFYIHAGRPADGLPHIDRALRINPDAHFGREKYQKLLVEYVRHRRPAGPPRLPLAEVTLYDAVGETPSARRASFTDTFEAYLRPDQTRPLPEAEVAAAVKGVLGMMRFGKYDSPVLLEALGTLLLQEGHHPTADAKLLAARAFLKASYEVPDGPAREAYRAMAARALQMQTTGRDRQAQVSLERVEADFRQELADARGWYADLEERERSWVRDGRDPEAEFDRLYAADPELPGMDVKDPLSVDERERRLFVAGGVILALGAAAALALTALLLRRLWARRTAARRRGLSPGA